MDFNFILLLTVVCSCLSFILRTLFMPGNRGWAGVASLILGVTIALLYFAPRWATLVGGGLWALFLLLPLLGFAQVNRLMVQERYQAARRLVTGLRWLHPADGWFEQPQILRALEMGQQGQMSQALQSLKPQGSKEHPMGRNATAVLLLMESRWPELLRWLVTHVPEPALRKDPQLLMYYLRALGEVGDLNGLVRGLDRYTPALKRSSNPVPLQLSRLFTLAFCGQVAAVDVFLKQFLASSSPQRQQFWRLTAAWIAAPNAEMEQQLRSLQAQTSDRILQQAIAWRLEHHPGNPQIVLSPRSQNLLAQLHKTIRQESRYGRPLTLKPSRADMTYGLLLLNGIFFALEIHSGGSKNPLVLEQLGALIPEAVRQGEWWRLLAANFLHYGWAHLLTNLLGLYLLGPFVEAHLGRWRYLLTYLATGVGTMGVFTIVTLAENSPVPKQLVGASAAIMGLLGVIMVILWQGWRQSQSAIAAERLRTFGLIIGLQFLFDLWIPEISALAHSVGLLWGLVWGLVWLGLIRRQVQG